MPFENREHKIAHDELTYVKTLGEGSFGIVFEGQWQEMSVAIKKFKMQHLNNEAHRALENEIAIMAKLKNDYIVQFLGFCDEPLHYAIVMEYMPMGSLYSLLHNEKPLNWNERLELSINASKGLVYLHAENILHRDIKSLNILISAGEDGHFKAKLSDFGLAKIKNETKTTSTRTNTGGGTVAWMAPELFSRRGEYTRASDIYSFAVVLWEIASRKTPFENAASPHLIPVWVQNGEREEIPEETPEGFKQIIASSWQADPNERPSAEDIVAGLTFLLNAPSDQMPSPAPASLGLQNNFGTFFKIPPKQASMNMRQPSPLPMPLVNQHEAPSEEAKLRAKLEKTKQKLKAEQEAKEALQKLNESEKERHQLELKIKENESVQRQLNSKLSAVEQRLKQKEKEIISDKNFFDIRIRTLEDRLKAIEPPPKQNTPKRHPHLIMPSGY